MYRKKTKRVSFRIYNIILANYAKLFQIISARETEAMLCCAVCGTSPL